VAGPDESPGQAVAASEEQLEEVLTALDASSEVTALPVFYEEERQERVQDIGLKRVYAWGLLGLLAVQILIVDGVLGLYAWKGVSWDVDPLIVDVWLGGTVIEVIAIVLVVTQHLFPKRDQ
jgi:hypothetical protein